MATISDVQNMRDYKDLARVARELGYGSLFEQLIITKDGKPSGSGTSLMEFLSDNPGLIEICSDWILKHYADQLEDCEFGECEECPSMKARHIPNPYESEINGDDTLHWLCEDCAGASAEEI